MGRYATRVITKDELNKIVKAINDGFIINQSREVRGNKRIAALLIVQANIGLRIGDILQLTMNSFEIDVNGYRINIIEEKTNKKRIFKVQDEIYTFIKDYAADNHIPDPSLLFPITVRNVQKYIKLACEYLGLQGVSTHSFRKYYATNIYNNSNHDVRLVQQALQHTSLTNTQKYIGISNEKYNKVLASTLTLIQL